jgi:EAL domain-containing protein (putative c-di-GMP-specific phosphodiesterase class I)/FixJ family two-component response regulator
MAPLGSRHVCSVLVIDDRAVQRQHAAALCRGLGVATVHEAAGGSEALALLAQLPAPPDLLLLDLEMPGMDGAELLHQLQRRGMARPVVVVSQREQPLIDLVVAMARTMALDAPAGLHKPLDAQALRQAFEQLGRRSAAGTAKSPAPEPAQLRSAIAQGQISVHYQPKVDVRSGFVRGVEALARWLPPGQPAVAPDCFVPLAEREGLIHPLTRAVMEQAFAQTAAWGTRGLHLPVAVNLSAQLLEDPGLVDEIRALAAHHALLPAQIVFELTESEVVSFRGAAFGVLARLRLQGFGLSLDDYGTGFSSMQQLARIPFTELKIDRAFVHGASHKRRLQVMLHSALDMAQRLELPTVAEGVETLADWRLLQQLGCTAGQGWLIARPMPAQELPGWLTAHRQRRRQLLPDTLPASHHP